MAGFVGADVDELRAFAKLVDTASRQLDDTTNGLSAALASTRWLGPDGSEFTSHWNSQYKPGLTRASGSLHGLVTILVKNADEQQTTSSDTGGGAGNGGTGKGSSDGTTSGDLGGKSVDDLEDLSSDELRDLAEKFSKDPDAAHDWWESLTPAEQARLIKNAPELVGGLDGVPALDRVAANANIAGDQIEKNDTRIKEIEQKLAEPWRYALSAITGPGDIQALNDELKDLKNENKYLQEAVDGDVQLYTYDRDADRIVEMIGNPETATQQLTWIPGTATDMNSFYTHGVQGLPDYVAGAVPGTVAFVMKDGTYPQWDLSHPPSDTSLAHDLGVTQAQFQSGLEASGFESMPNTAVGHSAGLAILTASESAGAHYTNVVSLSGIGMAGGWEPQQGTGYYDYTTGGDAILAARGVNGLLPSDIEFGGSILDPSVTLSFERAGFPLTPSEENGFSVLDPGIGWKTPTLFDPLLKQSIDNHSLIASTNTSHEVKDGLIDLLSGNKPAGS
ncbi:ABC transporter C-terminal domain-containing protein [Agreia pratensis]|uniref:Alpha/beta hydrolase n=1 Tax=Agreia pratensis TaxID=150121 RepID=A0A1X7IRT4_9MICO|nr:ABC transporter C-terminal domain-containing protein [Agreia pratensis]SMG17519.1 hypothetical protein SAMN06296010_0781 [Agreia pratensis]